MTNPTTRFLIPAAAMACLLASGPAAAQQVAAQAGRKATDLASSPSAMGLQGYSVVLVIGEMQGAGSTDTVPGAARKALTDMQAFLPYKRYQLLDAAWMLCCGSFRSPISGRVRGPNDREYSYSIDTLQRSDEKLTLRFWMRDEPGGVTTNVPASGRGGSTRAGSLSDTARLEHSRQVYEAIRERDEAEVQMRRAKQQHAVGVVTTADMEAATLRHRRAEQRVQDLQQLAGETKVTVGARTVMDSTFSIAIGETVVIGTSRLNGDQALIALLTAAAKPAGAR